jgi:hypothetical protein
LHCWDWLFGTLYLPREREKLEFGMARKPRMQFGAGALFPASAAGHRDRPDQQRPADFR